MPVRPVAVTGAAGHSIDQPYCTGTTGTGPARGRGGHSARGRARGSSQALLRPLRQTRSMRWGAGGGSAARAGSPRTPLGSPLRRRRGRGPAREGGDPVELRAGAALVHCRRRTCLLCARVPSSTGKRGWCHVPALTCTAAPPSHQYATKSSAVTSSTADSPTEETG